MTKDKTYCMNCGHTNHCGETLTRDEVDVSAGKVVHQFTMDVCNHCRCGECDED